MKTISKYNGITYPFFALKKHPFSIRYTKDKIIVKKTLEDNDHVVDDKSLSGDYLSRLAKIPGIFSFQYTCKNLQELLNCKAKWGVDSTAKCFDLRAREVHKKDIRKVVRIKNNIIFLEKISYPFIIKTAEKIEFRDDLCAEILFVEGEWYLNKFSYDDISELIEKIKDKV